MQPPSKPYLTFSWFVKKSVRELFLAFHYLDQWGENSDASESMEQAMFRKKNWMYVSKVK